MYFRDQLLFTFAASTNMSPSFEISARAKASLISGTNIEIEDKAAQYPPYDAITRLNDLTTLAGATQSLGDDMLKERMDKFAKAYSSRDIAFMSQCRLTGLSYCLWRIYWNSRLVYSLDVLT